MFLLPFLFFLWRGLIDRRLAGALLGIFALGAVQGAVGWWMVSSGLTERVVVSQYRLAFHLKLACIHLCGAGGEPPTATLRFDPPHDAGAANGSGVYRRGPSSCS